MKQSLQLRLGQSLTMTPQLQQAIRLLQLSSLELSTEIQQVLESNPMLESNEDETSEEGLANANGETESMEAQGTASSEGEVTVSQAADSSNAASTETIPEDLPVDTAWDDIYEPIAAAGPSGGEALDLEPGGSTGDSESLREHLLWQMSMTPFSPTDVTIAEAIIDAVNEDGYLGAPLEEIHDTLRVDVDVEIDEIEAVLRQVQNFDPVGVAARDLGECLCLQLKELDASTPWRNEALRLVRESLDVLASHDYNQLMRRMKLGEEDLQQVIELIRSLNPRPGSQISDKQTEYIVPDVYVRKSKGMWKVELNPDTAPRLRINNHYASLIRRADSSNDNVYMKNQLQEARWFLKSLQSRNETLLKVATCIVERQRGFLEHGEEAMKALVLHDIADAVSMHESTISRVTTRKYMHTPRGIYELKYFFSSHVSTADGGECSSTAIRAFIKKLVASEDAKKPLSDSKIAALLSQQGIKVARRTVAKYREGMSLPPSNERKRLI